MFERHSTTGSLAHARAFLANLRYQTGDVDGADAIALQMMESPDASERVSGQGLHGLYAIQLGHPGEGRELLERTWVEAADLPPLAMLATTVLRHWSTHCAQLRAPAIARRLVGRELNGRGGVPNRDPNLRAWDLAAAREYGLAIVEDEVNSLVGSEKLWDPSLQGMSLIAFRAGDWRRASAALKEHLDGMAAQGARQVVGVLAPLLADMFRTEGRYNEAEALLREPLLLDAPLVRFDAHAALGLICAETGRYAELRQQADTCRELMNPEEDWLGLGARALLLEALAELSKGNDEESRPLFRLAIADMQRVQFPWDEAEAHYLYGRTLQAQAENAEAADHYAEAMAILEMIQAGAPFLERVRRSADLTGTSGSSRTVRRPPTAPNGKGIGLSPREVEVLDLVAAGRSNRQIAELLVLSEATVATHIRHILEKTGASNRTEAAALMGRL